MNLHDLVASQKICALKYVNDAFLESIRLLNNVNELLEVVEWSDYMKWDSLYMSNCAGSF